MSDQKYNGWSNYETWNVKLWLDNDQGSSEWQNETARECLESADFDKDAASVALASSLEAYHDEMQEMCEVKVSGVFSDLLTHALGMVDWREIADNILSDFDVYSAGWNMPGYMPDSEPSRFLDAGDARSYIADEMESEAEQEAADDTDTVTVEATELREAAEACRKGSGEYGSTVGKYHYFVSIV